MTANRSHSRLSRSIGNLIAGARVNLEDHHSDANEPNEELRTLLANPCFPEGVTAACLRLSQC